LERLIKLLHVLLRLELALVHRILLAPSDPAEGTHTGISGVLPQDLGPGHVAREGVVELPCNGLHLGELPSRNSREVMVLIVISNIPSYEI
jgi:hypothetical protein